MLIKGNTQILFGGMGRLSENCVLSLKNKSHAVTAEIEVPKSGAEGVIIAQGATVRECLYDLFPCENMPAMNRRTFAVSALASVALLTGCDNDQKPSATAPLLSSGEVQDALKSLKSAISDLDSAVGGFTNGEELEGSRSSSAQPC